jgi:hypothetical protein
MSTRGQLPPPTMTRVRIVVRRASMKFSQNYRSSYFTPRIPTIQFDSSMNDKYFTRTVTKDNNYDDLLSVSTLPTNITVEVESLGYADVVIIFSSCQVVGQMVRLG